ncbi:MAG: hypothetical protein ACRD6N_05120, partial [Pyrinomonadaceae bacterium]
EMQRLTPKTNDQNHQRVKVGLFFNLNQRESHHESIAGKVYSSVCSDLYSRNLGYNIGPSYSSPN